MALLNNSDIPYRSIMETIYVHRASSKQKLRDKINMFLWLELIKHLLLRSYYPGRTNTFLAQE